MLPSITQLGTTAVLALKKMMRLKLGNQRKVDYVISFVTDRLTSDGERMPLCLRWAMGEFTILQTTSTNRDLPM